MENQSKKRGWAILIGLMLGLAPLIWVFISLNQLERETKGIYIYNPHDEVLNIQIDDEEHHLNSTVVQRVSLSRGAHRVQSYLEDSLIVDTTVQIDQHFLNTGGMLNLSGEPMYLWTEQYGSSLADVQYEMSPDTSLEGALEMIDKKGYSLHMIDSTLVLANLEEYPAGQLLIPREWYYGIDREFEDELPSTDASDQVFGRQVAKIFDKQGVLAYWEQVQQDAEHEAARSNDPFSQEPAWLGQ